MFRAARVLSTMLLVVINSGCVQRVKDVTADPIPKYTSIAGKTYATRKALFLVHDRGDDRRFLFGRDGQDFPYDPADFTGKAIRVAWGRDSYITDVIEAGTSLRVDRIEHVSGVEMEWDRVYSRLLTGRHAGETVQVEYIFRPSGKSEVPIRPAAEYLTECGPEAVAHAKADAGP